MASTLPIAVKNMPGRPASGDLASLTPAQILALMFEDETLTPATVLGTDLVLFQDLSDSRKIKTTTAQSLAGLTGDVIGPASSTNNALARFDLATGKLIQNSVGILTDAGILTGLTGLTVTGPSNLNGGAFVFNEGSADHDARFEGLSNTHLLFLDGGNNRVGISSGSLAPTDGLLHIQSASAGAGSADVAADELVIEGVGSVGMTIMSDEAVGSCFIAFADPGGSLQSSIVYSHQIDFLLFFVENQIATSSLAITNAGSIFNFSQVEAYDFRIASKLGTHLFFVDSSADRAGVSLSGNLVTDGLFHIASASAGAVTAHANADELVLEGSGNSGLSILSGATDSGIIYFGSSVSNTRGRIIYNHSLDRLQFTVAGNSAPNFFIDEAEGFVFNEAGFAQYDLRAEGDTSTHLFFIDSSANRVGFSLTGNLITDGLVHIASASAGATTANVDADELVIEGTGKVGLSILTDSVGESNIYFGDTNNDVGQISYAHGSNSMQFKSGTVSVLNLDNTRTEFNFGSSASYDFFIFTGNNNSKVFVDASTDKAYVGANIAATALIEIGGALFVSDGVGNTTAVTTEETLQTFTLPANTLRASGSALKISYLFTTAANTNSKTVRVYFGATVVYTRVTTTASEHMSGEFTLSQLFTSVQVTVGAGLSDDGAGGTDLFTAPTEDETGTIEVKITGQNGVAAANDITGAFLIVESIGN